MSSLLKLMFEIELEGVTGAGSSLLGLSGLLNEAVNRSCKALAISFLSVMILPLLFRSWEIFCLDLERYVCMYQIATAPEANAVFLSIILPTALAA